MTATEPAAVTVYCDAESHTRTPLGPVLVGADADARVRRSDTAVLGVFRRADGDGWSLMPDSARRADRRSRTQYRAVEAGDLRCQDCGDTVRVNADRFHADLDAIAAQRITAISVPFLREWMARRG